nr:ACT domain-containing protein [Nocardioides ginsengisegetis]
MTGFAVEGAEDNQQAGVLVQLLAPLAEEGISVFTISTFSTNWILVPLEQADAAAEAWRRRGETVEVATPVTPTRQSRQSKQSGQSKKDKR